MTLATNTRLGVYEVVSLLGSGGMGEVYRARDTKLGRDVAIKVLPSAIAADPDRLARFEREARLLASLNHPNIGAIYGVEESSGVVALVLELIDGETLADRIAKSSRLRAQAAGLPLVEALAIARQIADALDAAHERGIVHRDLKPGNIILTPDGVVKVLDFGLAKGTGGAGGAGASDAQLTHSPTVIGPTLDGVLLGTAPYMSPEQARGKAVDKRTDIWAFGCVLYEMLTGRRTFPGETTPDTIAAILEREPDWTVVPASTPARIVRLIERCLDKDPKSRLRDIGDARIDLDASKVMAQAEQRDESLRPAASRNGLILTALATGTAVALVLGYAMMNRWEPAVAEPTYRPIATRSVDERSPSWSPDGRNLAYVGEIDGLPQVFVTSLASPVPQQITHTPVGCSNPFWSPDGTRLFFTSGGDLWSVGAAGGEPVVAIKNAFAATVAPDGTLAFVRGVGGNQTLWIQRGGSAVPTQYVTEPFPRAFTRASGVEFSRDGSRIAVLVEQQDEKGFRHQLWLLPVPAGPPRAMPDRDRLGPGRDFLTRRLSWEPDNRHIVIANEEAGHGMHLLRADIVNGELEAITSGIDAETSPAVSPDGHRIAFTSGSVDFDILELFPQDGRVRPLLASSRSERFPIWLNGASRFAYVTDMRGTQEIWLHDEGANWPTPILANGAEAMPKWLSIERLALSRDGTRIAYGTTSRERHAIWIAPLAGGVPVPVDDTSVDQHAPAWSPDGNWLAYQRLSGTTWNLVKRPVGPGPSVVLADAPAGGSSTVWSPNGEWIAFSDSGGLRAVSPDGARTRLLSPQAAAAFDFTSDSRRIYAVRRRPDRSWELAAIDMVAAAETVVPLDIPATALVSGLSIDSSGRRIAASVGTSKFDVWLLDGYRASTGRPRR